MAKRKQVGLQNRMPREYISAEASDHARVIDETLEADVAGDLVLSAIEFRDPAELTPSPYNTMFETLKDDRYWQNLRRDIDEAGTITDPLLVLPNGQIVSGHSRRRVALELQKEGRQEFLKVPVRVVRSDLSDDELRKRVYLGNLSRFEIDQDTRLALYAEIYPEYFGQTRSAGQRTETAPAATIASDIGVSERQVRNEKKIYQQAQKIAAASGERNVSAQHITEARREKNQLRKKKASETETVSVSETPRPRISDQSDPASGGEDAWLLRQRFEVLREEIALAFETAVKKANAMGKSQEYLSGIELVARELSSTIELTKQLKMIKKRIEAEKKR